MSIADYELPRTHEGHALGLRLDLENADELAKNQFQGDIKLPPVDIGKLPRTQGFSRVCLIENQGQEGSCRGHQTATCCEKATWAATRGGVVQYNRQFAYLSGQRLDGLMGDVGSSMTGGAKAAAKYGLPKEEIWPYTGVYPRRGWMDIPAEVWEAAKATTLVSYKILRSYEEVLQWIVYGIGGVGFGIGWNETAEPNAQGRIENYRPGPPRGQREEAGHAVSVVDYDKAVMSRGGLPYLKLPQTWGKRWGINGWAWVSPETIETWATQGQCIGYADVRGEDIKPREMDWATHGFV